MMMSEPKRLHPIAALVNTLRQLKELIIPFVVFVVFGSRGSGWDLVYLIGSVSVLVLVLVFGILSWVRFTYRIEHGELRIEYGIFIRKKRYIPFERIQSLDVSQGILQRPFGLVKVKVETAGSGAMGMEDSEAVLTAITKEEASQIQKVLVSIKKRKRQSENGMENEAQPSEGAHVYKISQGELILLASTSGGVGVVLSAVIAFILQFEEFIPYERVFQGFEEFAANGVIFISFVMFSGFLLAWLISFAGTMVKYAGFSVVKADHDLVITRGLLEKRQFTIPLNRIQAVRISENPIRQLFGLASAFVESAGGSSANEESSKVLILPIAKKRKIAELLGPCLKEYQFEPYFKAAPPRAFRRYLLKGLIITVPIVLATSFFFRPWGFLSLLLLAFSALWSWLEFKDAGWSLDSGILTLRYRSLVKSTVFMKKTKVQSMSIKQSPFQRQAQLATIQAMVKSGHSGSGGKVVDLEEEDVESIYKWYSHEAGNEAWENQARPLQ
ncbi:PH domain-containing protein [Mesobacillus foraminis]|uniref:PH domain-containing protein n=1 Tax=Mesobacillus foraminis TaxID=279826 RepID=UPI00288A4ED4|nr:PH domain-containing protein [Mesobacillus foraminis]